jgi:DNA-binding NtrC family response regulator
MACAEIHLPALRESARDIPTLAHFFLRRFNDQLGRPELALREGALAVLAAFGWPGNLSQLQAVLFRAAAKCEGDVLKPEHFLFPFPAGPIEGQLATPAAARSGVALFWANGHLRSPADIEMDVIRLAIRHYGGRISEARRLGIGRSNLYRKLEQI